MENSDCVSVKRIVWDTTEAVGRKHIALVLGSPDEILLRQPVANTRFAGIPSVEQARDPLDTGPVRLHPFELRDTDPVGSSAYVQHAQLREAAKDVQSTFQAHRQTVELEARTTVQASSLRINNPLALGLIVTVAKNQLLYLCLLGQLPVNGMSHSVALLDSSFEQHSVHRLAKFSHRDVRSGNAQDVQLKHSQ